MDIGENIKKIRIEKGISRKSLSEDLNVSESTISRYENGKRKPNAEILKKIAVILDVPINELFGVSPKVNISFPGKKIFDFDLKNLPDDELTETVTKILGKKIESMYEEMCKYRLKKNQDAYLEVNNIIEEASTLSESTIHSLKDDSNFDKKQLVEILNANTKLLKFCIELAKKYNDTYKDFLVVSKMVEELCNRHNSKDNDK